METTYFATEDQLKAKKWDMLEEAKVLRGRKAALDNQWSKYAASWRVLGHSDANHMTIRFEGNAVNVLDPSQGFLVVDSVPQAHFDGAAIDRLSRDREETKEALAVIEGQLKDLGVTLS